MRIGLLLLVAGCGFGLDNSKVDPCAIGTENCCTGDLELIGPNGPALQVIADMTCPDSVGPWEVQLDGATVADGEGEAPNETAQLNFDLGDLGLADGAHTLTLIVGPAGDLAPKEVAAADFQYGEPDTGDTGETTTDTDTAETGDTAPQLPELQPGDVLLSPESGRRGESLDLSFKVYSYGAVDAGATTADLYWSTDLTLDGGDDALGSVDVPALATGSNTTLSGRITIPSGADLGNAFVLVVLDPDDDVEESDETNNLGYSPVEVAGPDLGITSITLSSSAGSADVDVLASWDIENSGGAASDAFTAKLYWSTDEEYNFGDYELASWVQSAIGAGGSSSDSTIVHIPYTTDDGYVLLVLDPDAEVDDVDRGNNVAGAAYATEAVDLGITLDGLSPATGSPGESVSVSMTLQNLGTDRAGAFDVAVYWSEDGVYDGSDTRLTGASASYLNGGTTSSISLPVTMPSTLGLGTSTLFAVIDEGDTVLETDETNNTASGTFEVVGPNYTMTLSSVATSTPTPGSPFKVTWSITNSGTAASAASTTGVYLSSDTTWSGDDTQLALISTSALSAGGSTGSTDTVIAIPTGTSYTTWYILTVADTTGVLSESDESDNVGYISIIVS